MDLIEGQDTKLLQEEELSKKRVIVKSDITLFNPIIESPASLGSYGGNLNEHKGKLYNTIEIYTGDDGKEYAKNKYGNNVFLKKGLYPGTKQFYFQEIDGKYVLVAEQDGGNYYFLENGEQYFPKSLSDKIITPIKKSVEAIVPYFK